MKNLPRAIFIIPLFSFFTFLFCADSIYNFENLSHTELSQKFPNTYFDKELESNGTTGLYHPIDERTGIYLGHDGKPYTGKRSAFFIENDSLWYTQSIIEGKVMQLAMNMYDSTGTFSYLSISEYSLDNDGNNVTKTYSDRQTESLVLSDIKTENDTLTAFVIYHPNGQIAQEFQIIPEHGVDGLATIYDEQGAIKEQRLYGKGEIVETIVELE